MIDTDRINDITGNLIKKFGREVAEIGEFEPEMVCLEGLAAGLIAFNAVRYNRQPDEIVDAFCEGVRERLNRIVYGAKQ
jgi:hypothetical protein